MRKWLSLAVLFFLTGCVSWLLQGSSFFEEVWNEYADEFQWSRSGRLMQQEVEESFMNWANTFEAKKALLLQENKISETEEENIEEVANEENVVALEGNLILAGKSLSQVIEQYKIALEKLQVVSAQHQELKTLTRKICEKQKSSVKCNSL